MIRETGVTGFHPDIFDIISLIVDRDISPAG